MVRQWCRGQGSGQQSQRSAEHTRAAQRAWEGALDIEGVIQQEKGPVVSRKGEEVRSLGKHENMGQNGK